MSCRIVLSVLQRWENENSFVQAAKKACEALASSVGLTIAYKSLNGPCGVYVPSLSKVMVCDSLEPAHQLKTLVHELAHAMLDHGNSDKAKHVLELEAESAAFIVCDSLGLDTSDYSFAYLAGWAQDAEEVLPAAECACKLADKIMEAIRPA